MLSLSRHEIFRFTVIILWIVAFVLAYLWFESSGIPARHVPRALRLLIKSYGWLGPGVVLALFAARTYFFLPTTLLVLASISLYGPVFGFLLALLGDNLSATLGFFTGRFLGRGFVTENERGWLKKYDEALSHDGFLAVLLMRLVYFPFDLVNFGCGISGIPYRQYAVATGLGLLPALITLTVLGDAFINPRAYALFILLFVLTVGGALLLHRSKWAKKRLYKEKE